MSKLAARATAGKVAVDEVAAGKVATVAIDTCRSGAAAVAEALEAAAAAAAAVAAVAAAVAAAAAAAALPLAIEA